MAVVVAVGTTDGRVWQQVRAAVLVWALVVVWGEMGCWDRDWHCVGGPFQGVY